MLIEIKEQPKAAFTQQWFDYKDGVKLLIASSNKPSFNRMLELSRLQAEQEILGYREVNDETAQHAELAFNRALAHLLLGWVGIEAEAGKPMEYSLKNAEILCTSSNESIEIAAFVFAKAFQLGKDKNAEAKEAVGKPSNTSSTAKTNGTKKKQTKSTKG